MAFRRGGKEKTGQACRLDIISVYSADIQEQVSDMAVGFVRKGNPRCGIASEALRYNTKRNTGNIFRAVPQKRNCHGYRFP